MSRTEISATDLFAQFISVTKTKLTKNKLAYFIIKKLIGRIETKENEDTS